MKSYPPSPFTCKLMNPGETYIFICNNFEIASQEIAFLYKKRWNIELLFKKLKQSR